MTEPTTTGRRPARRTLVKGAAWAVPAVMIAAPAHAACASNPAECPVPTINFAGACATTGNGNGCSGQAKALQVPVTLTNPTASPYLFVVEAAVAVDGQDTLPATKPAPSPTSPGTGFGFFGRSGMTEFPCGPAQSSALCADIATNSATKPLATTTSKVLVPAGTVSLELWYAFYGLGSADDFKATIWYALYDANTCTLLSRSSASSSAIPNNNCG